MMYLSLLLKGSVYPDLKKNNFPGCMMVPANVHYKAIYHNNSIIYSGNLLFSKEN
jgi:hypothetical protein